MSPKASKKIVLARFPGAIIVPDRFRATFFEIYEKAIYSLGVDISSDVGFLGQGLTEDEAWINAAKRISIEINHDVTNAILVWRFDDAPVEYRELSTSGGDEDWVAFVPNSLANGYIGWLEHGSFGCGSIDEFPIKNGIIKIGSHG